MLLLDILANVLKYLQFVHCSLQYFMFQQQILSITVSLHR